MTWLRGERIRGVDVPLPPGEHVHWEGAPEWRSLSRSALHVRKVTFYFAALVALRAIMAVGEPAPLPYFLAGAVPLAALGALVVGASRAIARAIARTSSYAVTDRRVVMRVGVMVPLVLNIPFRQIESAGLKRHADGTGDIALKLTGHDRLGYLHLWPHARAWRLADPEPTLRSIPMPEDVATLLRQKVDEVSGPLPAAPPSAPLAATSQTASERSHGVRAVHGAIQNA